MDEHHERIADAGEYVLGTLSVAERQAVEGRLAREPALLAEVYSWQDRLLGLHAHTTPMAVRQGVWSRIAQQLGPHPEVPPVGAANDPSWRSLRFWRLAAGCGLAASLVLGSLLGLQWWHGAAPGTGPRYLVLLQAPGANDTGWVVEAAAGGMVRLVPVGPTATVPPGKTLQFWTKPEGASRPTSLGLVRAGQVVEVPAAELPGLGARQLFELTLEPEGGSPVGRPTGPILFVGRALTL